MNLWRLHIRPVRDRAIDPIAFCLKNEIIGLGWEIDPPPQSQEEYYIRLEETFPEDNGWRRAINAIVNSIRVNDLVWFRDYAGTYYLSQVLGDWEYRTDAESNKFGVVNSRKVRTVEVGKRVPGKIESCFAPRATIQKIQSEEMKLFSKVVYNQKSNEDIFPDAKEIVSKELFELLTATELEDAVGLYLQKVHGYFMIPSSRSRRNDTINYEYELVKSNDSSRALVQVKSGNVPLRITDYDDDNATWWLFTTGERIGEPSDSVKFISPYDLQKFIIENKSIMPETIKYWLDYQERVSKQIFRQ